MTDLGDHLQKNHALITIATPNPEQIVQANQDPVFGQTLRRFDYLLPDGIGVVLASYWLSLWGKSQKLAGRLAGIDVVTQLLKVCSHQQKRVLLIGGRDYKSGLHHTNGQNVELMSIDTTLPTVVGHHQLDKLALYWWSDLDLESDSNLVTTASSLQIVLDRVKPDLVLVALGAPKQENFVMTYRPVLNHSGVKIAMVVGGSFDMLLGVLKRAPDWVRQIGLEWLYRLIQQPWRWRRQLRLIQFIWLTFTGVWK